MDLSERAANMKLIIVITKDRLPRSFRWTIRLGINQPNELGLSRADSQSRRAAQRVFGPLKWIDAAEAVADERNAHVVQCATVDVAAG